MSTIFAENEVEEVVVVGREAAEGEEPDPGTTRQLSFFSPPPRRSSDWILRSLDIFDREILALLQVTCV